MDLLRNRTNLTDTFKKLREPAVAFQKAAIAKERELIASIQPTENSLKAMEDEIDARRLRRKDFGPLADLVGK